MYSRIVEWLNYHHLLYFWMIAKEGSISKACKQLRLAQPTLSGQLRALEESLGEKLFTRVGRRLILTEIGRVVYRYADEIFAVGRELTDVLKGRPQGRPARLLVGISDLLSKWIAYRILQPTLAAEGPTQLVCYEDKPDQLLLDLSAHELDLVLTDAPAHSAVRVRVFSHLLGSCGVALFGAPALAARYRKRFPASLDGAPFLLPMENSASRRALQEWFDRHNIHPTVVGEFQDNALLNVFGQAGLGIFAAPDVIEHEVSKYYQAALIGRLDAVTEDFYAISAERKIKHPAVSAISEAARQRLFGNPEGG